VDKPLPRSNGGSLASNTTQHKYYKVDSFAFPAFPASPTSPSVPAGDKVVADGLVVESHGLVVDEASLTGESDPIKKNEEDPWCRSGTQVRDSGLVSVLWG
jgi:hypothetical protein